MVYVIIATLTILGSALIGRSISENSLTTYHANSTRAFWIAEAGLNSAINFLSHNQPLPGGQISFGSGTYQLNYSIATSTLSSTGTFNGVSRTVQITVSNIPPAFLNAISVGHDFNILGLLAKINVTGNTLISGAYKLSGIGASATFNPAKQTGVNQDLTTIKIPDYNGNGTTDEYSDFVQFGRSTCQSLPEDQVVYIQNPTNADVNIWPNERLATVKVIYIEGSAAGAGTTNIIFDASWRDNEDLTVISTGNINYLEPLQVNQQNARLSTISWGDYTEGSIFMSQHQSVVYSHDDTNFVNIISNGTLTGNVITNDNLGILDIFVKQSFFYSDRAANGDLPPGFSGLSGSSGTIDFSEWREGS